MHRLTHRQKAVAARKNPPEEDPEFQIAPMIDILLVLLVFFMSISSTEVLKKSHGITLPVAMDGKKPGKNPGEVVINVFWTAMNNVGSVEINDIKYANVNDFIPILQKSIATKPDMRVLIRADRLVKWDYMKSVMKAIASAQVANVTFSVVNKEKSP